MFAKRIRSTLLAAAVMACAMASAIAAPLPAATYKSSNYIVFSIEDARKIESTVIGSQQVVFITYASGETSVNNLNDPGGAVFGKIRADNPQLIATSNGLTLYNQSKAKTVGCPTGAGTVFTWYGAAQEQLADGCALFTQSTGKTN